MTAEYLKNGTTEIDECARMSLGITRDEYALCYYTYFRSENSENGWCNDEKEGISDFIGISRAGLYRMINRLMSEGLVLFSHELGIRATSKFVSRVIGEDRAVNYDVDFVENDMQCDIYLIKDTVRGCYKIGRSKNANSRFRELKTANAAIELCFFYKGIVKDEQVLHEMFATNRITGEWFDLPSQVYIDAIHNYFAPIEIGF